MRLLHAIRPRLARGVAALIGALIPVLLAGCIVIPIPGDKSRMRSSLDDAAIAQWQAGTTRRDDVLFALGDPDDVAADGSWLAYEDYRGSGHVLFITGGPYVAGGFATDEVLHYRKRYVFFDAQGLFRDTRVDAGTCSPPPPCLMASRSGMPEQLLVDAALQGQLGAGEAILERWTGAAREHAGHWVVGVVVITSRAVLFLDRLEGWPHFRPAVRLPYAELASAEAAAGVETPGAAAPSVAIVRGDGSRVRFAFKPRPFEPPLDAPPFDRDRAQNLLEAIRVLRP